MKTNKVLLGGIAGAVSFFLLGWLVYGILLMNFTKANYNQCSMRPMEEMVWWAMILSNLAYGFLLSFVCGWSNTTRLMDGAKIGGIIGLLLAGSMDFGFYAMSTMFSNLTAILVDIFCYTVMSAIVGAIVAWVMSMGSK